MSLLNEYIEKIKVGWAANDFENELTRLILEYNKLRHTYLLVFVSAISKPIPAVSLDQSDYYIIRDLLVGQTSHKLDIYLETLGGRGESAEEIVRFLHNKFDTVSFVVSGEAKSAGTIMVLGGDEIFMTETGSLGPIDAQIKIGRSIISGYDYLEWVEGKRKEAKEKGYLNPFDATMIAQITPGELGGVYHALNYARDLVVEWLPIHKFRNWNVTETRKKKVTKIMREKRAAEIANWLTDHAKWRSHGRSIKIDDFKDFLKIGRVDEDPRLADIVYRIQIVCTLMLENTTIYKIFATADNKIFKHAVPPGAQISAPQINIPDVVGIDQKCPKCGKLHKIYAKLASNPKIDADFKDKGVIPFPKNSKLVCDCGFEIDLFGIKNQIEVQTGRKIIS